MSSTLWFLYSALPQSTKILSLQPMEIVAIVGIGCVIIIALVALFFIFWCHKKRRHRDHHQSYTLANEKGRGAASSFADSSFSSPTTLKGPGYFPDRISFSEYKGTTPPLNHTQPRNIGSLSRVESVWSQSYGIRTPTEESSLSPLLYVPEQTYVRNASTSLPISQASPRRLPPLTIPISGSNPPGTTSLSPSRSECDSPDVSPIAELSADTANSPSMYSQYSAYPGQLYSPPLPRGPSLAFRAVARVPSTIAESTHTLTTNYQSRPSMENIKQAGGNGALSDRAFERPLPALPSFLEESSHRPIVGGLNIFDFRPISNQEELGSPTGSELARQDTVVIASLLKSRQKKQAGRLLPALAPSASIISHIERSGSIRAATSTPPPAGSESKGVTGREPYGRRRRRMKAERDAEEQLSNAFQGTGMES